MKAGLFGGDWDDYLDGLNDAFDKATANSSPRIPGDASAEAHLSVLMNDAGAGEPVGEYPAAYPQVRLLDAADPVPNANAFYPLGGGSGALMDDDLYRPHAGNSMTNLSDLDGAGISANAVDNSVPSPPPSAASQPDAAPASAPDGDLTGFNGFHDSPVETQTLAPAQPADEQATSVLGRAINGGSDVGNALRKVPLIGGILGNVGDVAEGAGHFLTGNVSNGVHEIAGGVGGLGQIGLADALAAGTGALGKAYVTGVDLANVLSGGTLTTPDRSTVGPNMSKPTGPLGAVGRFVKDLIVPTYGLNSGANWGSTQFGDHGPYFNLTDDAARVHDAHLNDREWVNNIAAPAPDGVVPNGPVGIANFLLGAIPFWLHNGIEKVDNPTEVTLTK